MQLQTFQSIISEFQARKALEFTRRTGEITLIPDTASVIAGPRRCGKTYRTYQCIADLYAQGVSPEQICRIQFNDLQLRGLKMTDLLLIDRAFYSLHPGLRGTKTVYFVFDEIQRIEGWEDYVLHILDMPSHRVLITGSTSHLLSGSFATQLRGKCLNHMLHGFSFREYCAYHGIQGDAIEPGGQARLLHAFQGYLLHGSMPGVYAVPQHQHVELLQTYWHTMLVRDILEVHAQDGISFDAFSWFAQSLASRIGCPATVRKLHENLSSAGLELSSEAGYRYLRYLKECFTVYAVPMYTQSEKIRTRNPVKIYACDWALASAVSFAGSVDVTRMFENMVFLHLLRQGRTIHYFTTRQGHEVDFVTVTPHAEIELFQACYELNSTSRDRELRAIVGAAQHLGATTAIVVTWAQEETVSLDGVRVDVVPAWRWMWDGQSTASR